MAGLNIVKLPESVDLQSSTAREAWEIFEGDFDNYLIATGQDECPDKVKIALLKNMLGSQGRSLFETFDITAADKLVFSKVKNAYRTFVAPKTNPLYDRFIFHQRVQHEGETFDHFLTDCRRLVKPCGYDRPVAQEENMLIDRIVQGIRDSTSREALLRMENATLVKVVTHCRLVEQSQQQAKEIQAKTCFQDGIRAPVDFVATRKGQFAKPRANVHPAASSNEVRPAMFVCTQASTSTSAQQSAIQEVDNEVRPAMFVCTQASTSTSAPQSAIQEVDDEERPAIVGPSQPSTSTSTPLQEQCSCRKRLNFTVNSSWDIPNESRNESYDETKQYDTEYGNEELENLEDWYWEEEVEWCNERVKEEVEKMDEDGDEKCEEKDIEDNGQKASDDNNGGGHDVQVHDMWEEDSSTEGETFRASNKPDGTHPSKKRKLDYSENECLESLTKKLKKM